MRLQIANCKLLIGLQIGSQIGRRGARRIGVCVALLLACAGVARADEVIDRVLAVVGGEMITLTDVTAARDLGLVPAPAAGDPVRAILSRLIDRELVLAEVDRYAPPEPAAAAVDADVRVVRARFATDEAFQRALQRSGIDEKHLRETLREDLRIRAYLDQRFAVPVPSDEDVRRYYRDHLPAFTREGEVPPLEAARPQIVEAILAEQRKTLVNEWIAGLRRRGDITDLYLTAR
jgi:hypothetical protein